MRDRQARLLVPLRHIEHVVDEKEDKDHGREEATGSVQSVVQLGDPDLLRLVQVSPVLVDCSLGLAVLKHTIRGLKDIS